MYLKSYFSLAIALVTLMVFWLPVAMAQGDADGLLLAQLHKSSQGKVIAEGKNTAGPTEPGPFSVTDYTVEELGLEKAVSVKIAGNLTTNTLGGAVTQNGLDPFDLCGGEEPQPRFCLQRSPILLANLGVTPNEPHVAPSFNAPNQRGLSQLRIAWVNVISTAQYRNDLPAGARNVSGFEALQFRVSVNFEDPRNASGQPQDLSVILTDGLGRASTVRAGSQSRALFFPPGADVSILVPKVVQNSVRIPLSSFRGVNLGDIRSIRFRFDRRGSGALLISDLAFASSP